jgi:acetyltransferase-like isoleucine patch superfamily enzyme
MSRVSQAVLRRIALRRNVVVGTDFHVGPGSVVWAPRALDIGRDVYLGKNVTIQADGIVGDGVLFANLSGLVGRNDHDLGEIGTSIRRSRWVGDFPAELSLRTVIGSDVWIGYGAIVLSGVTIGDSSVIAAGAVVVGDIPSNSIAVGSPARVVRSRFTDEDLKLHWDQLVASGHRILVGSPAVSR